LGPRLATAALSRFARSADAGKVAANGVSSLASDVAETQTAEVGWRVVGRETAGTVLHVAALPFPTQQGTQAAVRCMLDTLSQAGRADRLLAYAHAGHAAELGFPLHRSAELLRYRSLRSGPSAHKLLADGALGIALARLVRRLRPELIVAHHVEAAALAAAASALSGRPFVFFAHTDLAAELPTYAPPVVAGMLRGAGALIDAALVRRAHAVAAISPLLGEQLRPLAGEHAGKVYDVTPPWPLPEPISARERVRSRAALGLDPGARVLLYAGNLDRYQGWEEVLAALPAIRARVPSLVWLIATHSDPAPLRALARRAGVGASLQLCELGSEPEPARRALHAAADLAIVPRRSPGGLPIKLLDAMARGVPCVAAKAAAAGLPLAGAVELATGNDASALAAAALRALARSAHEHGELGRRGRAYVAVQHGADRFLHAFDRVCAHAVRHASGREPAARVQVF
jgi:glycosyltransferase involved in cell wall biosynthesis